MNLEQIKQDMMMEEAIASAELAGANIEDVGVSPEHRVGTCAHSSNGEFITTDDIKTKCILCGSYYKV